MQDMVTRIDGYVKLLDDPTFMRASFLYEHENDEMYVSDSDYPIRSYPRIKVTVDFIPTANVDFLLALMGSQRIPYTFLPEDQSLYLPNHSRPQTGDETWISGYAQPFTGYGVPNGQRRLEWFPGLRATPDEYAFTMTVKGPTMKAWQEANRVRVKD